MTIDALAVLIPPPDEPCERPDLRDWAQLEAELGLTFPDDFKQFLWLYGSGKIDDFLWVLNPASANENLHLLTQLARFTEAMTEVQSYGEIVPYKLFPEHGYILPFALTDNGDVMFWITAPHEGPWRVGIGAARESAWEEWDMPMTNLLSKILSSDIETPLFPSSFPSKPAGFSPSP